eukprot:3058406-Pyramimonas_sp.AAC.1
MPDLTVYFDWRCGGQYRDAADKWQHREESRPEPQAPFFFTIFQAGSICDGLGARGRAKTPVVKELQR